MFIHNDLSNLVNFPSDSIWNCVLILNSSITFEKTFWSTRYVLIQFVQIDEIYLFEKRIMHRIISYGPEGCPTMYNDDIMHLARGLFHYPPNYFLRGYTRKPADHYYRPFYTHLYKVGWLVGKFYNYCRFIRK